MAMEVFPTARGTTPPAHDVGGAFRLRWLFSALEPIGKKTFDASACSSRISVIDSGTEPLSGLVSLFFQLSPHFENKE